MIPWRKGFRCCQTGGYVGRDETLYYLSPFDANVRDVGIRLRHKSLSLNNEFLGRLIVTVFEIDSDTGTWTVDPLTLLTASMPCLNTHIFTEHAHASQLGNPETWQIKATEMRFFGSVSSQKMGVDVLLITLDRYISCSTTSRQGRVAPQSSSGQPG